MAYSLRSNQKTRRLTVPLEASIFGAHERKAKMHENLELNCENADWQVNFCAIEVGHRGFVTSSVWRVLSTWVRRAESDCTLSTRFANRHLSRSNANVPIHGTCRIWCLQRLNRSGVSLKVCCTLVHSSFHTVRHTWAPHRRRATKTFLRPTASQKTTALVSTYCRPPRIGEGYPLH